MRFALPPSIEIFVEGHDPSLRAVYDIRRLVTELPKKFGKLSRLAKRYIEAHSWSADLLISKEYVDDAVRWHETRRSSLNHAKTALIHSAVICYTRVFDASSKHRSDFKIGDKLSGDALVLHEKLLRLRHEALAHFGPEGTQKPWSEDMCVLIREGITWQPAVIARRTQFEVEFANSLRVHFDLVHRIVTERVTVLHVEFQEEISRVWFKDKEFDGFLKRYELNADIIGGWDGPVLSNRAPKRIVTKII